MGEALDRYRNVADGFRRRLDGVAAGDWGSQTPCTDWTVADLVAHVVGVHRRVVATVTGHEPVDVDPAGDLPAQWRQACGAVLDALGDETLAESTVSGMFGEQTFESLVSRLLCADTLVHTWDLARATGQDESLDPDAVDKALLFLTPIDDALRRPGGFSAKIDPRPGADGQTRLLNFCGRAG
jgi:uncharacterized protein (TIGR03086 family)